MRNEAEEEYGTAVTRHLGTKILLKEAASETLRDVLQWNPFLETERGRTSKTFVETVSYRRPNRFVSKDVFLCKTSVNLLFDTKKVRSYIARYPVFGTAQSALHFIPWQTCSFQRHLNFSGKHSATLQLLRDNFSFRYLPLSVARYSCIQLGELWQRGLKLPKLRNGNKRIRTRVLSIESPTHFAVGCTSNTSNLCANSDLSRNDEK